MFDVCIIGAGVVGSAIARELSKYKLKICWFEKEEDVSCGASKANSGIIHGGYSAKHKTLKGELCITGNSMYEDLNRELNFGYRKTGALVLAFSKEEEEALRELYDNGIRVGSKDLRILTGTEIRAMEPHISKEARAALYDPSVGVASPYEYCIALAENAVENGVELRLNNKVIGVKKEENFFEVVTDKAIINCSYVINAAGVHSDEVSDLAGAKDFAIHPRRGQYILLNKDQSYFTNRVIFQVPTNKGKGILVTPTYHGNLMIGPNAEELEDRADVGTSLKSLEQVVIAARKSIPDFDIRKAITTFSGIRAMGDRGDFIIEESSVKNFINVAAIDSPGLTSSPAIALKVVKLLSQGGLSLLKKDDFKAYRAPIFIKKSADFHGSTEAESAEEHIICRCETVTEAEIVDALHRGITVKTIDGVKRRTRAGMGPCQGNYCCSRVTAIIAREYGIATEDITKRGKNEAEAPKRVELKLIRAMKI